MKNAERKVLNIDKDDFDIIKRYCQENTLSLSKWISKTCVEKIKNIKTEYLLTTVIEYDCEIFNEKILIKQIEEFKPLFITVGKYELEKLKLYSNWKSIHPSPLPNLEGSLIMNYGEVGVILSSSEIFYGYCLSPNFDIGNYKNIYIKEVYFYNNSDKIIEIVEKENPLHIGTGILGLEILKKETSWKNDFENYPNDTSYKERLVGNILTNNYHTKVYFSEELYQNKMLIGNNKYHRILEIREEK